MNVRIKLPFLISSIPEKPKNKLQVQFTPKRLEMVSDSHIKCHGDADVLCLMGLGEVYAPDDLVRLLGAEFAELPQLFVRCQALLRK